MINFLENLGGIVFYIFCVPLIIQIAISASNVGFIETFHKIRNFNKYDKYDK